MLIEELSQTKCREFLARTPIARLGCSNGDQPYIVPIGIAYEDNCIYFFSTLGKKIEWMRSNPKVCVQADQLSSNSDWISVIANGEYEELVEPGWTDECNHARKLLERQHHWWLNALAERRNQVTDLDILPIFFRVRITSISGLRGVSDDTPI